MAFKSLRLFHGKVVSDALRSLMEVFVEAAYMRKYLFENIR